MRILSAILIGLALGVALPAAQKKPALQQSAAPAKTQAKSKTAAKSKAKAGRTPTRYAQQVPSAERTTQIQQALVERGYLPAATGSWGAESISALKKFQEETGLPVDGKLGALSLTALGLGPRHGGTVEEAITAGVLPSGAVPTPLD